MPDNFFLKACVPIALFVSLTVQCTWTPEVTTPVHSSVAGTVALQTSRDFKIAPQHPQVFSETLLKQILQGISQSQERGILQELFISDSQPAPVFTPTQIAFLTPHLVDAFSKATSEELITFRSLRNAEEGRPLSGRIAIFAPSIFFLTLQNTGSHVGNTSKTATSTGNLLKKTNLVFFQKQSMLQGKDIKSFIETSPKETWIAINYATLDSTQRNKPMSEERSHHSPLPRENSQTTQPNLNSLQKEMRELREKTESQEKEIQRLQNTTPQ